MVTSNPQPNHVQQIKKMFSSFAPGMFLIQGEMVASIARYEAFVRKVSKYGASALIAKE